MDHVQWLWRLTIPSEALLSRSISNECSQKRHDVSGREARSLMKKRKATDKIGIVRIGTVDHQKRGLLDKPGENILLANAEWKRNWRIPRAY